MTTLRTAARETNQSFDPTKRLFRLPERRRTGTSGRGGLIQDDLREIPL